MYILNQMSYKTKLQKWGNSLAVRIPSDIVRQLKLERGSELTVEIKEDVILVKPAKENRLEDFLEKITPENLHTEVDWGSREGNEV